MKKHSTNQNGSASMIIIAVLFLALMATLGVVFYQNFVTKPQVQQTKTNPNTTKTDADKTARITFNNEIYDVDYPANGWSLSSKSANSGSTIELVNTAGTLRTYLEIAPIQSKDACNTSDGLQVSSYSVSPSPVVKQLTKEPLYLVEALTDALGGGYQYAIGLTPEGGETHASVGVSHCEVAGVGIASPLIVSGKEVVQPAVIAKITFPKLPGGPKAAAPDMQTIKDLMNSDDYKAAVKILESARKE